MKETIIYHQGDSELMVPFAGLFATDQEIKVELSRFCETDCLLEILEEMPKVSDPRFVLIKGASRFEDAQYLKTFYNSLIELIESWVGLDENLIFITFFEYFNSGSAKAIGEMLSLLDDFFEDRLHIVWLSDDENFWATGKDYKDILEKESFVVKEIY